MNNFLRVIFVASIPVILMVQFYQGHRHTMVLEERQELQELQKVYLEENKKILAGITVYSAPARIYRVATEILGLKKLESNRRSLVHFPEGSKPGSTISESQEETQQNNSVDVSGIRIPGVNNTEQER